jgi:hypothetical protein
MSCANVLVGSDERVSVIDFHTPQTTMYLHQDVARLVVDVEMIGIQVALALGRAAASRRAAALRRAVLHGYAGPDGVDSVPTYFFLAAIADRWLAYDERLSLVAPHTRAAVGLAVRWRRRLLQALAVTYADELEARLR